MALFHRRDAPPAEVVARLPRDERVVSWADTDDGSVVLATPAGIRWPESGTHRLVGWHLVDKVVWRERLLVVTEAEVIDDLLLVDRAPLTAQLSVPRDLPPVIRKRVEANIVRTELVPVPGGSARFVARRLPGADGLGWWARLEPGTPDNALVRDAVADHLAALRTAWAAERATL